VVLVVVVSLAGFQDAALAAQRPVKFGVQACFADDVDLGLGGRVVFRPGKAKPVADFEGVASFDFFFPGENLGYWELNFNALYVIPSVKGSVKPYAGGGLNVAHASVDDIQIFGTTFPGASDTDIGFNVIGGMKFELQTAAMEPFAEVKFELGGGEQFVLTGGLRF
jgi:opacity protein-like surface antigen